jgi:hypothetical protein
MHRDEKGKKQKIKSNNFSIAFEVVSLRSWWGFLFVVSIINEGEDGAMSACAVGGFDGDVVRVIHVGC